MKPPQHVGLGFVALVLTVAVACASKGGPAVPTPAPTRGSPALDRARASIAAGQLAEAAMLLDEFLAVAPAGRARNEALETAAFVRMSSPPDARDLRRARELLIERQAASPPSPRPLELSATLALIEESVALRGELEEARAAAAADRQSLEERGAAAARDQRQLRAENASLRTEVKNLREELRKKEDALQKLAATVVKTKPRD